MSSTSRTDARFLRCGTAPKIAIQRTGAGEGVFFIHGVGGHGSDWLEQLAFFSSDYETFAWDARGYGDSDDYDGPVTINRFASDLAAILRELGVPRAHLVGLSMGGFIAQELYRCNPALVASLCLADTAISLKRALGAAAVADFVRFRRMRLQSGLSLTQLAQEVAPRLVAPDATLDVISRAKLSYGRLRPDSYMKALEACAEFENCLDFSAIHVPVLVIQGSDDTVVPMEAARELAAAIPNCQFEVIPHAGHLSNLEKPAKFNEILHAFLSTSPGGSAT